jgi:hypothetical protein
MEHGFDITLRDHSPTGRSADRLWEDLAMAAECADPAVSARDLAERILVVTNPAHVTLPVSRAIYGIIAEAAYDLNTASRALGRVADLILLIKPATLAAALRSESDLSARAALLANAATLLPVPPLLRLVFAASAAYERPLSPPMRELLTKAARTAVTSPAPDGPAAEALLRSVVGSQVEVVAPGGVGGLVTQGFHPSTGNGTPPRHSPGRVTPEADRIVHIALETGAQGDLVLHAVAEMIDQGRVRELLDAIRRAPDSAAAASVTRRVATPAALTTVLAEDPLDRDILDVLISGMGIAAAKPLLEALVESRSRNTRRLLLERLARLGPDIGPLVESRLRDTRWFVLRNMLALLREAGCLGETHTAGRFLDHKDARVRREAILLLLENPKTRADAIVAGLRDTDRNNLRTAIQNARTGLPDAGVPILATRLREDMEFPPEFRVMALHLIGRSQATPALETLLHFAQNGTTLLGKPRLSNKSPEMLAALGGLARSWRDHRRARPLIDSAARSRDPQIAGATRPIGGEN